MSETTELMEAFTQFKRNHDDRLDALQEQVDVMQSDQQRGAALGDGGKGSKKPKPADTYLDAKTGEPVLVLGPQDALASFTPKSQPAPGISGLNKAADEPSLGRVLRGIVLGNNAPDHKALAQERASLGIGADTSGGYLLDSPLSSRFIDLVRARMVLNQAGVLTIPMDGATLDLVKLTADPSVSWHGENQDLPESEPSFGRIKLTARTIVCLVKMSLEVAQDAANLEQVLAASITGAMAGAIDDCGLNGVTTNAAIAPAGLFDLSGRKTVTSIGAPTSWDWLVDGMYELLADKLTLEEVGALIAHPAVWKKMRKLKTGITSDNTPLTAPAEVAALRKLWTTAAPLTGGTAKAVIGRWSDMLFGVRKQITVRMLNERFLGDKLQVAMLAYARVEFAQTRAASFCTMEGITV